MGKAVSIDSQSFETLLSWLAPSREAAGQKYENIRGGLVKLFVSRGFHDAEDLADVVINRVIGRLPDISNAYEGEPANYFYGVARNVLLEAGRRKEVASGVVYSAATPEEESPSVEYECLVQCLGRLPPEQRELMLDYYLDEKQLKIAGRKHLAEKLNLTAAALRVRAHRIRVALEKCVRQCVAAAETKRLPKSIT